MIKIGLRTKSEVMADYDRESTVYTQKRFSTEGGKYIDLVEKTLLSIYARGPSLLEVGTATGRFIPFARGMGWNYTGVDLSRRMLFGAIANGFDLVQADGEKLPFRQVFDSIICLHTFHFIPDPINFIRESSHTMKRDGSIVLIFEMDTWLRRLILKSKKGFFKSNQYYFKLGEVARMMESCGLKVTAKGPVLKFPMMAYRKLPLTKLLKLLDSSQHFPRSLATLGFVVGKKP